MIVAACSTEQKEMTNNVQSLSTVEQHRPVFHFTPPSMWMNDPNGMVFYEGEYHLFYQHFPDSTVWGPMHWGHAVSKDLVNWEHLPIALYPDSLGYIFSGSAVVDWNNTSGLGDKANPPMVAIFTYHDPLGVEKGTDTYQTQGIAFSLDKGRVWEKYAENPVLENPGIKDFRDPKVFWHEKTKKWVMIFAAQDRVKIYHSANLKEWTFASDFGENSGNHGGVWECPDLFVLDNPSQPNRKQWVMLVSINPGGPNGGSATQYFLGDFDGEVFTNVNPDSSTLWVDYGKDNYAGVTWSDIPKADGRRIFIGWMSNWQYANKVPTEKWRSAMIFPRTLSLSDTELGLRLVSKPVAEISKLREKMTTLEAETINVSKDISLKSSTFEVLLQFDLTNSNAAVFGVTLSNELGEEVKVGYDTNNSEYFINRIKSGKSDFSDSFSGKHVAPRLTDEATMKMRLLVDVASVELFADDGLTVLTEVFFPNKDYDKVSLYTKDGSVNLKEGKFYPLKKPQVSEL